jgi:hypothetical protein
MTIELRRNLRVCTLRFKRPVQQRWVDALSLVAKAKQTHPMRDVNEGDDL